MILQTLIALFTITLSTTIFAQDTIVVAPPPVAHSTEIKGVDIKNEIIDFPDVEAQFKGGSDGFQKYISKSVRYPQEAIENNIQGKVYLCFIIEKSGEVSNLKIERGAHALLDTEARRVIADMPKWKPDKKDGKKVRTRVRLPINFTLD